jgi:hypothetical protein
VSGGANGVILSEAKEPKRRPGSFASLRMTPAAHDRPAHDNDTAPLTMTPPAHDDKLTAPSSSAISSSARTIVAPPRRTAARGIP